MVLVLGKFRAGKDGFWGNFQGLNIFCTPAYKYLKALLWTLLILSFFHSLLHVFSHIPFCLLFSFFYHPNYLWLLLSTPLLNFCFLSVLTSFVSSCFILASALLAIACPFAPHEGRLCSSEMHRMKVLLDHIKEILSIFTVIDISHWQFLIVFSNENLISNPH